MESVLHVAIDVDGRNFHGAAYCSKGEGNFAFKCKPNTTALLQHLWKLSEKGFSPEDLP